MVTTPMNDGWIPIFDDTSERQMFRLATVQRIPHCAAYSVASLEHLLDLSSAKPS